MYILRSLNLKLNFLHPGLRFRILKFFTSLLGYTDKSFEVDFFGLKYPGKLSNHIDFITFYFGAYERGILNYLNQHILKEDMVILDVGSNIGHHSLFFSSKAKRVYSFEPYPKVRAALEEKISLNHLTNIEIIPHGLSDKRQKLEYFAPPEDNSGTGSFHQNHYTGNQKTGLIFELITGDEFYQQTQLTKIDFIKMDIEGFEHFALQGMKDILEKFRPIIMLEFNMETKFFCKDLQGFRALFPTQYCFLEFENPFSCMASLKDFKFETAKSVNLICYPQEKCL